MGEFKEKLSEIKKHLEAVKQKLALETTPKGQSLLQVRICSMLDYIIHLHFYTLLKVNGKPIEDIVEMLIKDRILLEKTKPLELKLKYQIDRLAKETVDFKPQPEQLLPVEELSTTSTAIYKPPKIQPMLPSVKKTPTLKKPSKILRDLQEQYDDKPELIADEIPDHIQERNRFEEENFVRLTLSKKERKKHERFQTDITNEFKELTDDFKNIKNFIADEGFEGVVNKKRPATAKKDEFKTQKRLFKRLKK